MDKIRKMMVGHVISDKMDKTVVVSVSTINHHPMYKKTIRAASKYKAHDEKNECKMGDIVRIVETRPLSKEKRWRVEEIMNKGEIVEIQPGEIS